MYAPFVSEALNGDGVVPAWGVKEASNEAGCLYGAMFLFPTASRLSQLCESMPDADWAAHKEVLEEEGYDVRDPADLSPPEVRFAHR